MDLVELSRRLENVVRVGTIHAVDFTDPPRCRVQSGGIVTAWLPWIAARAGDTATWDPPTVGEQALVLSPSGEPAAGIVLVGLYASAHAAPSINPDLHVIAYPDGARITYDHAAGALSATGIRTATVEASELVTIDCPATHVTGRLTVDGLLTYNAGMHGTSGEGAAAIIDGSVQTTGDVTAGGISVMGHRHPDAQGDNTGTPL